MNRRHLLAGLAASALSGSAASPEAMSNTFLEIKTWKLHNSAEDQNGRVTDFLQNGYAPAVLPAGAKLVGAFASVLGPDSPYILSITQYASLGAMQDVLTKLSADEGYQQALAKLASGPGWPLVRMESSLLRSFDGVPTPVLTDPAEKHAPRVFELRTYESPSPATLSRKVKMFNDGEIGIFQRLGMRPVFFGETVVGPKQPNLMYMLSFDDMAERDKLWRSFGADPEWKKLSAPPALHDSEIVSNISNAILRPLAFSLMR